MASTGRSGNASASTRSGRSALAMPSCGVWCVCLCVCFFLCDCGSNARQQLHNFGGSNALGGEVAAVAAAARDVAEMGLAGIGIAPEGFGANELE